MPPKREARKSRVAKDQKSLQPVTRKPKSPKPEHKAVMLELPADDAGLDKNEELYSAAGDGDASRVESLLA